jgi:hypothetical protein
MARRRHQRTRALLESLLGRQCSLVEPSHGGELVIGYGSIVEASPHREATEWMLFTRATPWFVETDRGVVSASDGALSRLELDRVRRALLGRRLSKLEVRNSALRLSLTFDTEGTLELVPRAEQGADPELETWQLRLPDDQVILAYGGQGVRVVPGSARVSDIGNYPMVPLRPTVVRQSLEAAAAMQLPPSAISQLRSTVTRVCRDLGLDLYERRVRGRPSGDFLVVPPGGPFPIELRLAERDDPEYPMRGVVTLQPLYMGEREVRRPLVGILWRPEKPEMVEEDLRLHLAQFTEHSP